MSDPTEAVRREQVEEMPAVLQAELEAGRATWDTQSLQRDFSVEGFMAPYVVVRRKSDGQQGTLQFTHRPRYYFGWEDA